MTNGKGDIATHLAKNLSALRHGRGLSQAQLARQAGIPRSTLAHMESGSGNPSLQALARISGSLQVSIEELISRPRPACKLIKNSDVPSQERGNGLVTVFKLLPDPIPGMEIDRMELKAGARMGGVPHVANTREYLACVEGQIQVAVAGEKFDLTTGDVLAFPGDQPHSYRNNGRVTSVSVSVVVLAPPGL